MEIFTQSQNNQGIGKYKVLSTNAGVGSVVTTKSGFYIMPQSSSVWGFVKAVNTEIINHGFEDIEKLKKRVSVDIIDDPRFIEFLRKEQELEKLNVLVDVPHLSLDEWNRPKVKEHPLSQKHNQNHPNSELNSEHFSVPAIYFPRWFYSAGDEKIFKPLKEWKEIWKDKACNKGKLEYFAPPRDPYKGTNRTFRSGKDEMRVYETLTQIPMLLICKNGHISDIPWYQLFCAVIDGKKKDLSDLEGFDLFDYDCKPCEAVGRHELQFFENRQNAESWGLLKCKKCKKTASLEGVMNIKPFCKAETPWNGLGTKSDSLCVDSVSKRRTTMQMALVTSNSIYYADLFSSLYIPPYYLGDDVLTQSQNEVLNLVKEKWFPKAFEKKPTISKEDFWDDEMISDKADDANYTLTPNDLLAIKKHFLSDDIIIQNTYENYRYKEFKVFSQNTRSHADARQLEFKDIELPDYLSYYFQKIQQVNTLALTSTQLGFSRVTPPSPKLIDGAVVREQSQNIYSQTNSEVIAYPASQSYGEGLFFELNPESVDLWINENKELFSTRYEKPFGDLTKSLQEELKLYGAAKFYLLHTFSHLIIKELEFSCGYPAASLQERLYYSDRMCGVLILTTDGGEGSMGGLVWQGQPHLISQIIKSALTRATECSSDPLCWENEDQLNFAACFSCGLVSETTCEQRNLGLDRRALIDEEFGFFKDLIE